MAGLPAGTVTFLFTDIEGSTRLLQQLDERYATVLSEHREILRAAFAECGGREVDTQGDAFFAAFGRAADALTCAERAQRQLLAHAWPDGVIIGVRMGLHTGEPALSGGGYVGLDVHRAARICAAGHGGQILLSQATRELVEGRLPEGATLRDLGERRLKDLQRPERIYQLVAPGLPSEFPPLKTLDPRNNLPAQTTPLVGREDELREARELLLRDEKRLLTLTGPGGIGKTRLALQIASELVDAFADGVFLVALSSVDTGDLVAPAIARTLGLRDASGRSEEENLRAHLAERRLLLVLDNFEQVIEAADVVADLLASAPGLKALISSREPLRLRGEQEYPLAPLPLPDEGERLHRETLLGCAAIALFVQRARATRPDFELTDANVAAVVEICRRLDGLPLALELAAAHVKTLSPEAMVPRLASRLSLLTGGPRDLPARQRTLRSAIEWSYDLLSPDERTLFQRLSIFVGGWTLDAAEAVGNLASADAPGSVTTLELLEALVDKSLVRRGEGDDGEPRFRMMETIAEYGVVRLAASGEERAARAAHAEYCRRLAEAAGRWLTGQEQRTWLARLEREHANLRAALVWLRESDESALGLRLAAALWRFWYTHGYLAEGRRWLDFWLERTEAGASHEERATRAKALLGAGTLASVQGEQDGSVALIEESLAISRELEDDDAVAGALNALGLIALQQGDHGRAAMLFSEGLHVSRRAGDPWIIARALNSLGQSAYVLGDYQRAATLFAEALELMRGVGSRSHVAITLLLLGHVRREQEVLPEATALYHEALSLSVELGDKLRVTRGLEAMATVFAARGTARPAARLLGASSTLRDEVGAGLHPLERPIITRTLDAVRAALDDAFDDEWSAGRALSLDDAVALALSDG